MYLIVVNTHIVHRFKKKCCGSMNYFSSWSSFNLCLTRQRSSIWQPKQTIKFFHLPVREDCKYRLFIIAPGKLFMTCWYTVEYCTYIFQTWTNWLEIPLTLWDIQMHQEGPACKMICDDGVFKSVKCKFYNIFLCSQQNLLIKWTY